MRKGGKQVRLKLFRLLAADLSNNVLGKQNVIWCPLCLNEFGREAAESGLLTEEHVIPESTGNEEVTLTCKPCNDETGHQIDHHIDRKVRYDRALKNGELLKGKLRWDSGGSPVDMYIKNNGDVHFDLKTTSAHVARTLAEKLTAHVTGERPLRVRMMRPFNLERYAAALVKSAYLGLFVDRGYAYALLPALDAVRKAILEDGEHRAWLSEVVVPCHIKLCTELPQPPDRITFETRDLGTVPVCLSYINLRNLSGGAFVVLPPQASLNTGSLDGLARAAKTFKHRITFDVQMQTGGKITLTFEPGS